MDSWVEELDGLDAVSLCCEGCGEGGKPLLFRKPLLICGDCATGECERCGETRMLDEVHGLRVCMWCEKDFYQEAE